jgi:hypothetical protein
LLGRDFAEDAIDIEAERGRFRLSGLAGLPSPTAPCRAINISSSTAGRSATATRSACCANVRLSNGLIDTRIQGCLLRDSIVKLDGMAIEIFDNPYRTLSGRFGNGSVKTLI